MISDIIESILYEYKITAEQLYLLELLSKSQDKLETYVDNFPEDKAKYLQNLLRRGYIKEIEEDKFEITAATEDILDRLSSMNITYCTSILKKPEEEVEKWIDDFRGIFHGLKLGAMGGKASCVKKMRNFFRKNPDITKEDVIKATKAYIDSLGGDYRYLQQADYFILKNDNSKLEAWIEEIKKNPNPTGDWTTSLV